jgi:hypothetical protein
MERDKKERMCYEEREKIEHMWNGCSEMRERERKEPGEIPNKDEGKIGWMKEIWTRRARMEKERSMGYKEKFFFGIVIF